MTIRLRSHCTVFCKRLNACAEICRTNPLLCSECKIFACGKKLAHAKKHKWTLFVKAGQVCGNHLAGGDLFVSKQITYTRVQARSIVRCSFQK